MTERRRRARNKPWKRIYGADRKYTARVDRARGREAARVWAELEEQPGFSEELRQAERDIAEGRGTPFSEVRR